MMALIAASFASCSKETADAEQLLATVPSDASVVVVANLNSLLQEAGCKVDGEKITPSEAITKALSGANGDQLSRTLLNGESGIDPEVAVIFAEGGYSYLAGTLADASKFKAMIEKEAGTKFAKAGDVEYAGAAAVKSNRFWVKIGNGNIDPERVANFASLSKNQSILSVDGGKNLVTVEHDMEGWADIPGLMNMAGVDFQTRAMLQVALQTIFQDPNYIEFYADFQKNEGVLSATVLNGKGKAAKLLFPGDKIDVKAVAGIGGKADILMAGAVSQKLIKDITKKVNDQGASMIGIYLQAFSSLDGTFAVATTKSGDNLSGIITTTGENTASLSDMLASAIGTTPVKEGKTLKFSKGTMNGTLDVAQGAEMMKGAMFGTVVTQPFGNGTGKFNLTGGVMLVPGDGTLSIQVRMQAPEGDKTLLERFIEAN